MEDSSDLVIPRAPFQRLVREFVSKQPIGMRIQKRAIEATQESAEMFITALFQDALLLTYHRKRKTVLPSDLKMVQVIREQR